jgi:arylsulfatase A-like enzyme
VKLGDRMGRKNQAFSTAFPFFAGALFLIALLLLLEVIFQMSKVSEFSKLMPYQKVAIPFNSFLFLSIPIIALSAVLYLCSLFLSQHQKFVTVIDYGRSFGIYLLLIIIVFFHLDTLCYSAFQANVYSLPLSANIILLFLMLDIAIVLAIKRGQRLAELLLKHKGKLLVTILIIGALSLFFTGQKLYAAWREAATLEEELAANEDFGHRPNIVLISADSLDRRRLGVYGYVRDTTPHISSLQNTILYTRAYTNCGNSRGSLISMLTGKNPITTKLIFPPDILHGDNAFQHLPSILAGLGYYNIDLNDGFYASTSKSNLRDGFHMENGHESDFAIGLGFWKRLRIAFSDETYFLENLFKIYKNKISFMAGGSPQLFDYSKFLMWGEGSDWTDAKRVEMLKQIIRETDQPVFAHIHLVSTHGPLFMPPIRKFSGSGAATESPETTMLIDEQRRRYHAKDDALGAFEITFDHYEVPPDEREKNWNLYDDAVVSVDNYCGEIFQALREAGKMDNTLIIIFSDHGMGYFTTDIDKVRYPLPLIVRLPGRQEKMVTDEPVQYIDVAPSILAYLNQPIPAWMEGTAIFEESIDSLRLPSRSLLAAGFVSETTKLSGRMGLHANKIAVGPPYYGIDLLGLTMDNKYYLYSTEMNMGRLYDVSNDPYVFRAITDAALLHKYHDLLYQRLRKEGIHITQDPA